MASRPSLTFTMKRDDLLPPLTISCVYAVSKLPIDLSSASAVRFMMTPVGSPDGTTPTVDAAGAVYDGPNGLLRYTWSGADTATAGSYRAEFEVTIGGKKQTFPQDNDLTVNILEDKG